MRASRGGRRRRAHGVWRGAALHPGELEVEFEGAGRATLSEEKLCTEPAGTRRVQLVREEGRDASS